MADVAVGEPLWTRGHFSRVAAQDDLGIEALGAGLLRELVPGVVQTSISAGYYSFYPFLLDEFERRSPDELQRSVFQSFYRRQEAAFAVASSHHEHRGNLLGINGINAAWQAGEDVGTSGEVDLASLAAPGRYMKTGLGGYGLFYRPALQDIGATRLGSGNLHVDRATDAGKSAAEGVRTRLAGTEYWQRWADEDVVPMPVLAELGQAICPCDLPGRPDHDPVVDLLFRNGSDSEQWETLRRYRVESFGLLLEFHDQRDDDHSGIAHWRRALISGRIGDAEWQTSFDRHRDAWRAYQYRETLVAALTTIFSNLLFAMEELEIAGFGAAASTAADQISWGDLPGGRDGPLEVLVAGMERERLRPAELVALAESAMQSARPATIGESLTLAVRLLGALAVEPEGDEDFKTLLGRGDEQRLSVEHMAAWLRARSGTRTDAVVLELMRFLFHRHLQVATSKLSMTDHRDPYCVAEDDDGLYRVIRGDEPFWTGARFATLNHLLWTAGVLTDPDGAGRPTDLGTTLLAEVAQGG